METNASPEIADPDIKRGIEDKKRLVKITIQITAPQNLRLTYTPGERVAP
jgi:hypothetical protein